MNAREWVDFLKNRGVDIVITTTTINPMLGTSSGGYLQGSDQLLYTPRLNKETVFHELGHWTGNKKRLNRDMESGARFSPYDPLANDLEESIAWEFVRLMVERFGGGNRYYYKYALKYSMKNSPEAKWFGKQAFEFICNEFNLE